MRYIRGWWVCAKRTMWNPFANVSTGEWVRNEKCTTTKIKKQGLVNFLTEEAHPTTNLSTHTIGQPTTAAAHLVIEMVLKKQVTSDWGRREVEHKDIIRVMSNWLQMKHCHSVTLWVCLPPVAGLRNVHRLPTGASIQFFVLFCFLCRWEKESLYPDHRHWKKYYQFIRC